MKMKRTLAGVAAGLVAVSAMATAVSADQETINLHYDLRTRIQTVADGTVTVIQTYENAGNNLFTVTKDCPLIFGFSSDKLGKLVEARADFTGVEYTQATNGDITSRDFTESLWYADKDRVVDDFRAIVFEKGDTAYIDTDNTPASKEWLLVDHQNLRIPVAYCGIHDVVGTGTEIGKIKYSYWPVTFKLLDDSSIADTVTVQVNGGSVWNDSKSALNGAELAAAGFVKTDATVADPTHPAFNQPIYSRNGLNYYATVPGYNADMTLIKDTNGDPIKDADGKVIYQTPNGGESAILSSGSVAHSHPVNSLNGSNFVKYLNSSDAGVTVQQYAKNEIKIDPDNYHFKKITVALTYEVPSKYQDWINYNNWDVDGSYKGDATDASWLRYFGIDAWGWTDQTLNNLRGQLTAVYPDVKGTVGKISFGALATKPLEDHYFPLMTTTAVKRYGAMYNLPADDWAIQYNGGTWSDGSAKTSANIYTNDVIAAIRRSGVGTSPLSVLNDAIANDLDVQFTFTSAAGNIVTANTHARQKWTKFGESLGYDAGSCWSKTAFGQHLYSNSYSTVSSPYSGASFTPAYTYNASDATSDMYGSYSSAWAQNLVSAGLVVNSELTMQLNDTKKLVWNENQLTFNWFDVTDETKITRANQILTTMLLYTPVDWYWDSLDVAVIEPEEEEDVNAGEGIEEDGEVLDEEIEEEEVEEEEEEEDWEEEEEEEEPEIEEPEVEETEVEVVEVAPVASPKTGNSPIALAVIPVALAAAAVVAKKRG